MSENTNLHVLIVGSMAIDDLELPSGPHKDVVGGAATYASLAASLFAPVRVVAVVGEDFPPNVLDTLRRRSVDTTGIEHASGKTFRWAGRYEPDLSQRTTLDTQLNVFASFQPKLPADYCSSELVLLGNIHPSLQLRVLEQAQHPRLVFADTMNFWIEGQLDLLKQVLSRVDVLLINDEEARLLSHHVALPAAARAIRSMGPRNLIIKQGEHGALIFDENGMFSVPGIPLEHPMDPTGAGDTFAGALVGWMAAHADQPGALRHAAFFATAVASFCVEGVGTHRLAEVAHQDVLQRVNALKAMSQLPPSEDP